MSESVLEKGPTLRSKVGQFLGSLVYPKCSRLKVYNPQVMILDILSIIYKSDDPQISIPYREQLCVCVCVCVCGCYARDTAWGIPFLLVSRETALFRQAILRVLTKKHGCTPFTLCSHQTCGCIQNPVSVSVSGYGNRRMTSCGYSGLLVMFECNCTN